jgi:hypothetical protein
MTGSESREIMLVANPTAVKWYSRPKYVVLIEIKWHAIAKSIREKTQTMPA